MRPEIPSSSLVTCQCVLSSSMATSRNSFPTSMPTFRWLFLLRATLVVIMTHPCYIRARGLGAPAFRLFELKNGIGVAPRLVNGLDLVCACAATGYHTENLLLQVWASLYPSRRVASSGNSIIQGAAVATLGRFNSRFPPVSPPLCAVLRL